MSGLRWTSNSSGEDDRRLVLAAVPVFVFLGLWFSDVGTREWMDSLSHSMQRAVDRAGLYPVLVEQKFAPPPRDRELRALSDVDARGQGAMTKKRGFNTTSPHDVLETDRPAHSGGGGGDNTESPTFEGPGYRSERRGTRSYGDAGTHSGRFRIPANYNFQEEMRLNFGGPGEISLPRKRFPEFAYFQAMLRTIRTHWAPPGTNAIRFDSMGYTMQNSIKPQVVRVSFLLDSEGNVRDVQVYQPVLQRIVAESCVLALRGRNFGPPPKTVLQNGGVIGINFVFPPMLVR